MRIQWRILGPRMEAGSELNTRKQARVALKADNSAKRVLLLCKFVVI
jgi:hypothetical protein